MEISIINVVKLFQYFQLKNEQSQVSKTSIREIKLGVNNFFLHLRFSTKWFKVAIFTIEPDSQRHQPLLRNNQHLNILMLNQHFAACSVSDHNMNELPIMLSTSVSLHFNS